MNSEELFVVLDVLAIDGIEIALTEREIVYGIEDVRLADAIGKAEPLEKTVIIDGKPEQVTGYDLTPNGIIKYLDLKRPIYEQTARYGHFGKGFDWDK